MYANYPQPRTRDVADCSECCTPWTLHPVRMIEGRTELVRRIVENLHEQAPRWPSQVAGGVDSLLADLREGGA